MMTIAGWGGVGDSRKSKQSLLSFTRSELSYHLCHVDSNMVKDMEGLRAIFYDRGLRQSFQAVSGKDLHHPVGRNRRRGGSSMIIIKFK